MIENMSLDWILGWVLGMCGLGPLIQLIIIIIYIYIYIFFESVSLNTEIISETVFQF